MIPSAPLPLPRTRPLFLSLVALGFALLLLLLPRPVQASPGVCVGPVCGDQIHRSSQHPWQLRLRLDDQSGHRERILADCRDFRISPGSGPIMRGYASAVVRRVCRLAGEA